MRLSSEYSMLGDNKKRNSGFAVNAGTPSKYLYANIVNKKFRCQAISA
jgi:hypothetical protein